MPGEGCVENVKSNSDEVELGETEAVAVGERKVGLKALPLTKALGASAQVSVVAKEKEKLTLRRRCDASGRSCRQAQTG